MRGIMKKRGKYKENNEGRKKIYDGEMTEGGRGYKVSG